jgi:hypothetical protein
MFTNIKTAEMLVSEQVAEDLFNQVNAKKMYLKETDFKMTVDYFAGLTSEEQANITQLRDEARTFVIDNAIPKPE